MPSKNKSLAQKNRLAASMRKTPKQQDNNNSVYQPEEKRRAPVYGALDLFRGMDKFTPLFPIQTRKRLMYYEPSLSLTGSAGVYTYYVFSANGAYDPDVTSTGHSPIGWDQLMLYYEQATVLSSRITLRAVNNGAQASAIGIALSPDTATLSSSGVLIENGLNTSVLSDSRGTNGTGQRVHTLNHSCDVARYFARPRSREIVNDPLLYCTVSANPTEQAYYHIASWSIGGTADNTSYLCDVLIEYDIIFWEPRKAPLSVSEAKDLRETAQLRKKLDVHTSVHARSKGALERPLPSTGDGIHPDRGSSVR